MYRTLCVVALFAFSASALSVGQAHSIDAALQKCRDDYDVSQEVLKSSRTNVGPLLEDPETRCFAACILKVSKTDGTLNLERMIELLPESLADRDLIIEGFNACANEKGADSCETAYKTVKCVDEKEAQAKQ